MLLSLLLGNVYDDGDGDGDGDDDDDDDDEDDYYYCPIMALDYCYYYVSQLVENVSCFHSNV